MRRGGGPAREGGAGEARNLARYRRGSRNAMAKKPACLCGDARDGPDSARHLGWAEEAGTCSGTGADREGPELDSVQGAGCRPVMVLNSARSLARPAFTGPGPVPGDVRGPDPGPIHGDVRGLGTLPGTLGCPWACSPARYPGTPRARNPAGCLGTPAGPEHGQVQGGGPGGLGIWPGISGVPQGTVVFWA
jgi:hypothetical protein